MLTLTVHVPSHVVALTVSGLKNMHKLFLRLALATVAFVPAASALAADLEVMPPPPPTEELRPATYDWTGGYVGGWVGSICMDGSLDDTTTKYIAAGCGFKGGALAGYNFQMNSNFVMGIEGDLGMTNDFVKNTDPAADFTMRFDALGTLRARAGYAFDDTLLFVTAGGAWGRGNISAILAAAPKKMKKDQYGWVIGGGMEHAVTDQFRLRLDYLYTNWQSAHYSQACCNVTVKGGEHEVRVGAIWAF
jgi:outer membrane immunogenic protein